MPDFARTTGRFALIVILLICIAGLRADAHAAGSKGSESRDAARMRALNNSLMKIHGQMQQAGPVEVAVLHSQAAAVIGQRAAALRKLIETDPHAALSFAFSPELLADLARKFPSSASLLESHVSVSGQLDRATIDYPGLRSHRSILQMHASGGTLNLYLAGPEPRNLKPGDTVEATGVVSGYAMAVSSTVIAPSDSLTSNSTSSPACSSTGTQNTAVIAVDFPDATLPTNVTTQSISDMFFNTSTGWSMDGFLREASYGQTSATGNVFGPYTLTGTYASCTDVGGAVLNDAIAAATANGASLQNYSRIFLVFPDKFGCGWAGFASTACSITSSSGTLNSSIAYLAAAYLGNRADGTSLAAHELGHNMGLLHSGTITPAIATDILGPLTSPGTEADMGDYWSTMGEIVLGLYPAPQKAEVLGWMSPTSNYQVVQTSGSYTIQPLETSPAGMQALKIQRGTGNNAWLWIEYRQPIGNYDYWLFPQPFSGALVHYEDSSTALGHTYLANYNPSVNNSPALAVGQTWKDPYSNVSLAVTSATASGLTVNVTYGSSSTTGCTSATPAITLSPLDPSIYPGGTASYAMAITDNDSSGCASNTFTLSSTQPSSWPTAFSTTSVTLSPGQSVSVTMTKTGPSTTPVGTYQVDASASSNSSTGSDVANVTVMAASTITATVSVPKSTYTRKNTVPITATVLNGSTPVAGASVVFTVTRADGTNSTQSATTGTKGTATWNYKLGAKYPTGVYSVSAQVSVTGSASTQTTSSNVVTFNVQ